MVEKLITNIPKPTVDSVKIIEKIIGDRQHYKAFYRALKPDWLNQVHSYALNRGDPTKIVALDLLVYCSDAKEAKARKASLINMYSSDTISVHDILDNLRRQHGLLVCPCCGEDGAPGTLDHYLPKTIFPEFSVVLLNLTPMCIDCQLVKDVKYLTDDENKAFFHPYFDDISCLLIDLTILPDFNAPSFEIAVVDGLSDELSGLATSHIEKINFEERFETFCEGKYLHLLKIVADERVQIQPTPIGTLVRVFLRQENEKGFNAWGAIFYSSIIQNVALLDYLDNGRLPDCL